MGYFKYPSLLTIFSTNLAFSKFNLLTFCKFLKAGFVDPAVTAPPLLGVDRRPREASLRMAAVGVLDDAEEDDIIEVQS